MFRECLRIREVEQKIVDVYSSDLIQSPVHLSIGQEAVAVGVCRALKESDLVFPNYRGHSFYLARGGDLTKFFAELMGRIGGISKGKAGSMHLASPTHGVMGASAIVGSTISHAVGAALAERIRPGGDPSRVFLTVFGDGATEQGSFFESLNFASIHRLPVLFLCEDNGFAVHTEKKVRQSYDLGALAGAFSVLYVYESGGFDPQLVFNAAQSVVEQVRTEGPAILHVRTYRYKEHVGPGDDFDQGYRDSAELKEWAGNDVLLKNLDLREMLLPNVTEEIESAFAEALLSPLPGESELLTDVL